MKVLEMQEQELVTDQSDGEGILFNATSSRDTPSFTMLRTQAHPAHESHRRSIARKLRDCHRRS